MDDIRLEWKEIYLHNKERKKKVYNIKRKIRYRPCCHKVKANFS